MHKMDPKHCHLHQLYQAPPNAQPFAWMDQWLFHQLQDRSVFQGILDIGMHPCETQVWRHNLQYIQIE